MHCNKYPLLPPPKQALLPRDGGRVPRRRPRRPGPRLVLFRRGATDLPILRGRRASHAAAEKENRSIEEGRTEAELEKSAIPPSLPPPTHN